MPASAAAALAVESRIRSRAVRVCCLNLAAVVFLQRIIVPLGGEQGVSCLLPIAWGSALYLLWIGAAFLDTASLFACVTFLGAAYLSQIFGGTNFSATSLLLLTAIYLMLPLRVRVGPEEYLEILDFFQRCMCFVAAAVIVQYLCQAAGLGMPILEDFVPEKIIVKNFVYLQEVVWQSGIMKPNALVMLEASFLSQFLALALIVEFWIFRRNRIMFLFGATLLLTFSGTGMSLAVMTLAFMAYRRGLDRTAVLLLATIAVVALILLATGWLGAITGRLGEFSDPNASGSVRFVAPIRRFQDTLASGNPATILWGAGAGFIDREAGVAWNPPTKMWVEYGLLASVTYWIFLASMIRAVPSAPIGLGLALEYLFFGGGALLQPPVIYACFFLGIGYAIAHPAGGFGFVTRAPIAGRGFRSRSPLGVAVLSGKERLNA